MSPPIRPITGSQMAVFLVNSRLGLLCATHCWATLLPKLRVHFAEFLNARSLVRLRLLILPTWVGFRYGPHQPALRQYFPARCCFLFASTFSLLPRALTSVCGFACRPHRLAPLPGTTVAREDLASCVLPSKLVKVLEFEPDSHRLRLSSSS